jgi:hypothetical protein
MCIVLVWVEFDVGVAFVVIVVSFGVEEGREVVASSIGLVDFEAQCCDSVALDVALDVASSGSSVSSRGCHCTEVLVWHMQVTGIQDPPMHKWDALTGTMMGHAGMKLHTREYHFWKVVAIWEASSFNNMSVFPNQAIYWNYKGGEGLIISLTHRW